MSSEPTYKLSQLPKPGEPLRDARPCDRCYALVRLGTTVRGNRAYFDFADPHPNHHITCAATANANAPGAPAPNRGEPEAVQAKLGLQI